MPGETARITQLDHGIAAIDTDYVRPLLDASHLIIDDGRAAFVEDPNEQVKWALRRLYYRQRAYYETHGRYAATLQDLNADDIAVDGHDFVPAMQATARLYEISAAGFGGKTLFIRNDGKVWVDD